jgi:hypothetical protein
MFKANLKRFAPLSAGVACAIIGLSAPLSASAATAAVAVVGTVTLPQFPTNSGGLGVFGACNGGNVTGLTTNFNGAGVSVSPGPAPILGPSIKVTWYQEPGSVAFGAAQGSITANGITRYYTWARTGLVATISLTTSATCTGASAGSAVGILVPTAASGTNVLVGVATAGAITS